MKVNQQPPIVSPPPITSPTFYSQTASIIPQINTKPHSSVHANNLSKAICTNQTKQSLSKDAPVFIPEEKKLSLVEEMREQIEQLKCELAEQKEQNRLIVGVGMQFEISYSKSDGGEVDVRCEYKNEKEPWIGSLTIGSSIQNERVKKTKREELWYLKKKTYVDNIGFQILRRYHFPFGVHKRKTTVHFIRPKYNFKNQMSTCETDDEWNNPVCV